MNDPIIELDVVAVFDGTREVALRAQIGRAQADAAGGWCCAVELAPAYQEAMSVRGVDSFHATWLACSLVLKLLAQLRQEGVELRSSDGSAFPLEGYLAGLDGAAGDAAGR